MGTKQMQTEITLADLELAFTISDENMSTDMSAIRMSMIRDVHDDSIEFTVLVFGQENTEDDAPVAELRVDPHVVGSEDELNNGGVVPSRLRAIFSQEVLNLIVGQGVPIQWLCDDGSLKTLSLSLGEDTEFSLRPIDQ
jgi:hypothetical protein